jgi:hypothetical protein
MLNVISGLLGNGGGASNSYESISTFTVGSGGTSFIEFTSIPSTYKHLQIRGLGRSTNTTSTTAYSAEMLVQFNGDTGNQNAHAIEANGSSVGAQYQTSMTFVNLGGPFTTQTANAFGASILDILDYTNTNKFKTVRAIGGQDLNGYGTMMFCSGLWRSTSAITSVKLQSGGSGWAQNSSFALYGIKG